MHNSVKYVNGVRVLFLCTSSDSGYICTKFHENILDGIVVIERQLFHGKIFKGAKLCEKCECVTDLFSAHRLMVVYISTKFHKNILDGIKVIARTRFSNFKET